MYREIIIYKGDEHRAKMEKQFSRNDIFADVYSKAYMLVTEIEKEMKAYKDEIGKNEKRLARYQGMGNNMVIFCGGRGQGKTSVMQSFAKCLDGTYRDERALRDSECLDFVPKINHKMYEVVDSIDPSAMESEESIVRVLISRLFFKLEEYVKSDECHKDDKDFLQNKRDIVTLFEKCYANINCIKSKKGFNCEQDDLQALSQMGSSAKLKENLHDLIKKYLAMMAGKECRGEEQQRYLVIPIDDADLATKKLFRLCEDIRNYLSIPNVIILMAVDYEQLVYAIYQRYLRQYKVMRKADASSGGHGLVDADCHRMAAKYLEKVFPTIHRIDLPEIDNILLDDYEQVRFEYRIADQSGGYEPVFAKEDLEGCKDFQEQLLKILYQRTGMIFSAQVQKMYSFMPHTLRELTHWVKMLADMHQINCDDLYREYQKSEKISDELKEKIAKLRDNILTIKQYFMSYWCEKYLDIEQVKILRKIDSATRQHQMSKASSILCNYLNDDSHGGIMTYREMMREVVGEKLDSDAYFQRAFYIYYTIFWNEWFAAALNDDQDEPFMKIVEFIERPLDLSDYCGNYAKKFLKRFNIMQFDVNTSVFHKVLEKYSSSKTGIFIQNFCVVVKEHRIKESAHLYTVDGTNIKLNVENETIEFNILRPFLAQLKNSKNMRDSSEVKNITLVDEEEDGKQRISKVPYLITVRNILANCDVQIQMQRILDSWYAEKNESREFLFLRYLISDLYQTLQEKMSLPGQMGEEIMRIYHAAEAKDDNVINRLFLCNKDNFGNYIKMFNQSFDLLFSDESETSEKLESDMLIENGNLTLKGVEKIENTLAEVESELQRLMLDFDILTLMAEAFDLSSGKKWKRFINKYSEIQDLQERLRAIKEQAKSKLVKTSEQAENQPEDTLSQTITDGEAEV